MVNLAEEEPPKVDNKNALDMLMNTSSDQIGKSGATNKNKGRKRLKVEGQDKEMNQLVTIKPTQGKEKTTLKEKPLKKD